MTKFLLYLFDSSEGCRIASRGVTGRQYSSFSGTTLLVFVCLAASNAASCFGLPWFAASRIVNLGIEKSLTEILFEEFSWPQWRAPPPRAPYTLPKLRFWIESTTKSPSSSWKLFTSGLCFSPHGESAWSGCSVVAVCLLGSLVPRDSESLSPNCNSCSPSSKSNKLAMVSRACWRSTHSKKNVHKKLPFYFCRRCKGLKMLFAHEVQIWRHLLTLEAI